MKRARFFPAAIVLTVLLALSAGLSAPALSAVEGAQGPAPRGPAGPQTMIGSAFTYQGQLLKDGSPVNDTCTMAFRLYDDAATGNPVGDPITLTVSVAGGLFTAPLDFGASVFTGEARWLEVAVQCPGDAGFNTLAPRQALTAAPYALSLRPGALIDGSVAGRSALVAVNRATSGNGVWGQSDASDGIGVRGHTTASSGTTVGVYGLSTSSNGFGVRGYATAGSGTTYGVHGRSESTGGSGVYGWASAPSGTTFGVYGRSSSTAGIGVAGYASATSGNTLGVNGQVDSSTGIAVYGLATATGGDSYGVWGQSNSYNGSGVVGYATAITGTTFGVSGQSDSVYGVGVYGLATAGSGSGHGVHGESYSYSGAGVYGKGYSEYGAGVYGTNDAGIGVEAHSVDGAALSGLIQSPGTGTALQLSSGPNGEMIMGYGSTSELKFRVDHDGNVYADGQYFTPIPGFAEMLPGPAGLEAGDVLVVGLNGSLARCDRAYQPTVVGVYAPQAGVIGGRSTDTAGQVPLAVVGVVRVKVSAENGPIVPGDLLVAAATPGHAMRAGANPPLGTVIGKALDSLDKDTGIVLMLVMLR